MFIFDINTEYKFREVLADNVFLYDDEDYSCIWQNSYDKVEKLCTMDITVYRREGELFRRSDSVNYERAYETVEITDMLEDAGLTLLQMYGDMVLEPPAESCERIFFAAMKEDNG